MMKVSITIHLKSREIEGIFRRGMYTRNVKLTTPRVTSHKIKSGDVALSEHGLHLCVSLGNILSKLTVIWRC